MAATLYEAIVQNAGGHDRPIILFFNLIWKNCSAGRKNGKSSCLSGSTLYVEGMNALSERYEFLRTFFNKFTQGFLGDDDDLTRNTILKRDHTLRVCTLSAGIASSLEMTADDEAAALVVALLHDIGRFEQYRDHRTFSDLHSENHSLIALRVIETHALLSPLHDADARVIRRAIELHNAQDLPCGLDARTLMHAKLIRDADKLDILPIVLDYHATRHIEKNPAMEGKLPDTPGFSPEVVEKILASETISNGIRRNQNDVLLVQMAWLMDLNFPWSYCYAAQQRFAERMRALLPDDPQIDAAYEHVALTVAERGGNISR